MARSHGCADVETCYQHHAVVQTLQKVMGGVHKVMGTELTLLSGDLCIL